MKKSFFVIFCMMFSCNLFSQIVIDNTTPYSNIEFLIDQILLTSNLQTSNHFYEGDSLQIAYFNGTNSNIGFEGGIVMGSGDVSVLEPEIFAESSVGINVGDVDLNTIANSVPALIGQNFTVVSINDIAALEFDFIAQSDTLSFNYVFASQEYNAYENSIFNDVFGFFISGPGITGPFSSPSGFPDGSINIATFISQEENSLGIELPITISSINSFYNSQFYIDNQSLETVSKADGFTNVMTAKAVIQCGETYHIRLAIADGTDVSQSSFIFLEEKSFTTENLFIKNNLNLSLDSSLIKVKCGTKVTLSAEVSSDDDYDILWSNNDTIPAINVGAGSYSFQAINGSCVKYSDTIVIDEIPIQVDLGDDISICQRDSTIINLKSNDGTAPYTYAWNTSASTSEIKVTPGSYSVEVTDAKGCVGIDEIIIHPIDLPTASLSGGGHICEGQVENFPFVNVDFSGTPPFYYKMNNGTSSSIDTNYSFSNTIEIRQKGDYSIISLSDSNCNGDPSNTVAVTYSTSSSLLSGGELICEGDSVLISVKNRVDALPYMMYLYNGNYEQAFGPLDDSEVNFYLKDSAVYTINKIVDSYGCESVQNDGTAIISFKQPIFPQFNTFFDSILCPTDSSVLLEGIPEGGVFSGKGVDFNGYFHPINSFLGQNWVYYSFPENCNEIDSLAIEIGCESEIFIPNSFTPNSDSDNDSFLVIGTNIISFEMSVFSRWGELLFKSNNINEAWDGKFKNKTVPKGSYSYVISAYGKDAKHIYKNGYVNVIR